MNRRLIKSIDPALAGALFLLAVYIATSIGSHPPDKPIQFEFDLPLIVILILLGVGIGKQIRKLSQH
jgi:hypothetical protein